MALKVHTLHAATFHVGPAALLGPRFPRTFTCRCWVIETDVGLVLVDTGLGVRLKSGEERLDLVSRLSGVDPARTDPVAEQLPKLGFRTGDVRHIICTHLDFDHAGGVPDFPEATVHCLAAEHEHASGRSSFTDRMRYRSAHLRDHANWELYDPEPASERWFGLETVRSLRGLPSSILLVPLPGHTPGHTGVAVESTKGWRLHAGDAYFSSAQLREPSEASRSLGWCVRRIHADNDRAAQSLERLRSLERSAAEVTLCCTHDATERA